MGHIPARIEQTPMYEVTVEAGFSSGHYLRNYKGKCENPHGHNYKVRVTLAGKELDEAGLLLDKRWGTPQDVGRAVTALAPAAK